MELDKLREEIDIVDKALTLEGLNLIYKKNKG
jgi:hypothetical protein